MLIIPLLLAVFFWFSFIGSYRVDDAFIIYRFVDNLVSGNGFVFNPGERVEGVTCFLWVVLLTPFALLPTPLTSVVPFLSGITGLIALCLLPRLMLQISTVSNPGKLRWLPSLLLFSYPGFAYWSAGALETVPYTLLLLLCIHSYLLEKKNRAGMWSAVWGGLATLTRPEAPFVLMAVVFDMLITQPRKITTHILRWISVVALFFVPFLCFRYFYFGEWLPNTYYAKMGAPVFSRVVSGISYSLTFFGTLLPGFSFYPAVITWIGSILSFLLVLYCLFPAETRPVALLIFFTGFSVVFTGGDWMVMSRFWIPALPFLLLLFIFFLGRIPARYRIGLRVVAALSIVVGLSWFLWGIGERSRLNGALSPSRPQSEIYGEVSRYLTRRSNPDDTIALMDIGQIGYETKLRIIDITGLVTPWIAKSPGGFLNKNYAVARLLECNPRFLVLRPSYRIDRRILNDDGFQASYRLVMEKPLANDSLQIYEQYSR